MISPLLVTECRDDVVKVAFVHLIDPDWVSSPADKIVPDRGGVEQSVSGNIVSGSVICAQCLTKERVGNRVDEGNLRHLGPLDGPVVQSNDSEFLVAVEVSDLLVGVELEGSKDSPMVGFRDDLEKSNHCRVRIFHVEDFHWEV